MGPEGQEGLPGKGIEGTSRGAGGTHRGCPTGELNCTPAFQVRTA